MSVLGADQDTGVIIKHSPADFVVRECPAVDLVARGPATHEFLLLRKLGYTTFEAIRLVAAELGIAPGDVTYAGLKDEDGNTEQVIAVPVGDAAPGHRVVMHDHEHRLELHHYGYGGAPLAVGSLTGNGFRIVVRNVAAGMAQRFGESSRLAVHFLNYYDTQRFGVPNGKKLTHTVGAAILAGDWDTALSRLAGLAAPESASAVAWRGPARDFFRQLDPRVVAFYCAAHASFGWNAALRDVVTSTCPTGTTPIDVDGLRFVYTASSADAVRVLLCAQDIPLTRYTVVDGHPHATTSGRSTVVQTIMTVSDIAADECFPGRQRVTLGFFLPSGCYATAAMRQLIGYMR